MTTTKTANTQITESRGRSHGGIPWLIVDIVILLASIALYILGGINGSFALIVLAIVLTLTFAFITPGFYMVQPNQSAVLTLFGDYRGSDPNPGLRWANAYGKFTPTLAGRPVWVRPMKNWHKNNLMRLWLPRKFRHSI